MDLAPEELKSVTIQRMGQPSSFAEYKETGFQYSKENESQINARNS